MPVAPAVDVEEQPGSGVDEAAEGPKLETDNDEAATFEPIPLVLEDSTTTPAPVPPSPVAVPSVASSPDSDSALSSGSPAALGGNCDSGASDFKEETVATALADLREAIDESGSQTPGFMDKPEGSL